MNDELLRDLGAVGRLDARLHAAAIDGSPDSPEDQWTIVSRDHRRRDRLLEGFLADKLEHPPVRRRPGRLTVLLSTTLAIAASLLLAWQMTGTPTATQADPLGYVLSIEGGIIAQRGAPAASSATFGQGDKILLRLTPPVPMHARIALRVNAAHEERHIELAWPWRVDASEGVIEVDGDAGDLRRVAAGTWTLSVVVSDGAPPYLIRDRLFAQVEVAP